MCGIVGYVGHRDASEMLVEGLGKLSYRGYDSAGIAVVDNAGCLNVRKSKGKLEELKKLLSNNAVEGCIGIGHTRWATHGKPTTLNAHPHMDARGQIALVHNGIIENESTIRTALANRGCVFQSETDTEVVVQLLAQLYNGNMVQTLLRARKYLRGSYAFAIVCAAEPDKLFCVRQESPLVLAFHKGEGLIASDVPAVLNFTNEVLLPQNGDVCVISTKGIKVWNAAGVRATYEMTRVEWTAALAEKNGWPHYMIKEIYEQPKALYKTVHENKETMDKIHRIASEGILTKNIIIVGCGTAFHAGLFGKWVIERLTGKSVRTEYASEFRNMTCLESDNLVIAVSQSGETADTLLAVRSAKAKGCCVVAITNAADSALERLVGTQYTLHTKAGPEMAVASTKAYLTQVAVFLMLAKAMSNVDVRDGKLYEQLHIKVQQALACDETVKEWAKKAVEIKHIIFVGRGIDYAVCLEASLKVKEVSYLFSEAYPAGELKHGPIAMIGEGTMVIACVTQENIAEKMLITLKEVKARGADAAVVCPSKKKKQFSECAHWLITIPDTEEEILPLLAMIPLQLFAYYMALERGCDVDQPRNLAKSVTVE